MSSWRRRSLRMSSRSTHSSLGSISNCRLKRLLRKKSLRAKTRKKTRRRRTRLRRTSLRRRRRKAKTKMGLRSKK